MSGHIKDILELAVWAPSGDNSQPWRFELNGDVLEIYNLPDRDLPFYNFEQRGSLAAHGALVENICIVAPHFGLRAEPEIFAGIPGKKENLVAQVRFSATEKFDDPLLPYIQQRCTNRRPYAQQPLSPEQKQALQDSVSAIAGVQLAFVETESDKKVVGAALAENERIVLNTEHLHAPFFNHVVWNEAQEHSQKSGLYLKTLELAKPKQFIFKMASDWSRMRWLQRLGIVNLIIADNAKLYASASVLAALRAESGSLYNFFQTGRAMQRFWLTATSLGLSAHPVTGILFLMQRVFAGATEGLSAGQVALIKKSYGELEQKFSGSGAITFLFRVGSAAAPSARSSRQTPAM